MLVRSWRTPSGLPSPSKPPMRQPACTGMSGSQNVGISRALNFLKAEPETRMPWLATQLKYCEQASGKAKHHQGLTYQ